MQQQYRLNYPLLIGLFVGTLVCSGAVYGLWRFQIDRNAGALIADAKKAVEEGNYRDAVRYYANYLSIRGGDDEARVAFANAYADLAEQDDATPEELSRSLAVLESTVRRNPDTAKVQRRLAEFYFRVRRYQDALDHLNRLLEKDPENVELQVLRTRYLVQARSFDDAVNSSYKLVGYDPDADTFDVKKATAPHELDVYTNLAYMLRAHRDQPELAARVMDQLIEVNPESPGAFLRRGQFFLGVGEKDKGDADIRKAFELAPQDAEVLLTVASRSAFEEKYDEARKQYETGIKLYPEDIRFYQGLASLSARQQNYEGALAAVNQGLKAVGGQKAQILLVLKADLQFVAGDIKGMRQTVDDMRKAGFRPEYIEWTEARMLLIERKWFAASEALNRLRPRVNNLGDLGTQIDVQLGLCYERLGRYELALQAYDLVVQNNPQNDPAIAGKQRVLAVLGREAEADGPAENTWQHVVTTEMQKGRDAIDWDRLNAAVKQAEESGELTGVNLLLLKANIELIGQRYDAARQLLRQANEASPDNLPAYRLLVQVARSDPQQGPERALEMLDKVVKKFGDQASLRLERADLYIAIHKDRDQLADQLTALAEPLANWSDEEKAGLWAGLASKYVSLGMNDQAKLCYTRIADARPNNLPVRLTLFNLAMETNDPAGMEDAQNRILEIVKDKNDSTWLYTEARRLLWQVRRNELPIQRTRDIRNLVERAMQQRPDWADLHLLLAEVDLLEGKADKALADYSRAAQLGRVSAAATLQHIELLLRSERFAPARKLAEQLPLESRRQLLGRMYAEILLNTNDIDGAMAEARLIVDANPDDAANQLWYARLLGRTLPVPTLTAEQRSANVKAGTEAAQRAVELNPELVDGWRMLVTFHLLVGNQEEARQAVRDAQLMLSCDVLPQVLGRSYEMLGQWFDAESMYRLQCEQNPENAELARQLANFYLGSAYPRNDGPAKATPLVNSVLRAGAEGKIPANDDNLRWARRQGAVLLAATSDYQNLLKAEKLLASNSREGLLSTEDQLQMALILASRPEPASRLKAVQLFEAVSAEQPLSLTAELTLGQLYYVLGDWSKCRRQMRQTIGRFPEEIQPRIAYVHMLLAQTDRRDYNEAVPLVQWLRERAQGNTQVLQLLVRLSAKLGKQKQASAELMRLLPRVNSASEITDKQAPMMDLLAALLVELEDYDNAERIYRLLAARYPERAAGLAAFLGEHRDVEQCFQELEKVYSPAQPRSAIQVAVAVVGKRRDEVGDKYDAQIQSWLDRALRENPDSLVMLMLQSEFYNTQQNYEAAANIYRELLTRSNVTGVRRAVVLNNLSYILALTGDAAAKAEALEKVQEAAQIFGPTTDILDTRAVAYIGLGDYQRAIEDLELSVLDTPTASKYFHKAVAHLMAGDNEAGMEAWEKAEELGLTRESLDRVEHARYDEMKAKIDALRGQSNL